MSLPTGQTCTPPAASERPRGVCWLWCKHGTYPGGGGTPAPEFLCNFFPHRSYVNHFLSRTWTGNRALYGNTTATIAYNIWTATPQFVRQYRSNDPLEVVVEMRDYHNQTIIGMTVLYGTSIAVDS